MFRPTFVCMLLLTSVPQVEWEFPSPQYEWSFPRDHWAHETFRTEWWYVTGFLDAETEPRQTFAYQFTIFRVGVAPRVVTTRSRWQARNIVMGHAAITNLADSTHRFAEVFYRATPLLAGIGGFPDSTLAWASAAPGSQGGWLLRFDGDTFSASMRDDNVGVAMDLQMRPTKPLVFQGPNGFSRKDATGTSASMYYTLPRLTVTGSLAIDGMTNRVAGTGWMDREFSSSALANNQTGWDWFGLQLDDGRDLMVYVLRDSSGNQDYVHATMIDQSGKPTFLSADAVSLQATGQWTNPSGMTYPMGWRLVIDSEQVAVDVLPMTADQENVSNLVDGLRYWEGAVAVVDTNGVAIGRGFAELTGYGGSRPAV